MKRRKDNTGKAVAERDREWMLSLRILLGIEAKLPPDLTKAKRDLDFAHATKVHAFDGEEV